MILGKIMLESVQKVGVARSQAGPRPWWPFGVKKGERYCGTSFFMAWSWAEYHPMVSIV